MGYKSTMGGTSIGLHYLHCLHPPCAATTYQMKVQWQPTLHLHPVSHLTTEVKNVKVEGMSTGKVTYYRYGIIRRKEEKAREGKGKPPYSYRLATNDDGSNGPGLDMSDKK